MKIFYLITKSEIGGAQVNVYQLSKYFIEKGGVVAVMAYPGGWLEFKVKKMGGKFYPNRYLSNSPNPIKALKAIGEIKRAIQDFKPDLIGCHSTAAGFLGRIAIRNKIPIIFTAHGWGFSEGAGALRRMILMTAEKLVARYCWKIICVSEYDRQLALKYRIATEEKLITIHNGVEKERNNADNKQKDANIISGRGIKIVFVGRLTEPKDPILLLRAFNELEKELKDKAEVLIIGEGEKRKELERFIKNNELSEKVKLLGSLPREKVFETLIGADIFVLTSNWEGFPITILEAMSCSLPIIATDVGGVKEVVNNEVGFLIKRSDKQGFKNALIQLIESPDLRFKMGKNAKERVEKEFSLERMLGETEIVYKIA